MNKIEKAIEDTQKELRRLKNVKLCIDAQIETIEGQIDLLEWINRNETIPHFNSNGNVENELILKARWEYWDKAKESQLYETDEEKSPYCDGFTQGAKWAINKLK
jgi:hypothetical protein